MRRARAGWLAMVILAAGCGSTGSGASVSPTTAQRLAGRLPAVGVVVLDASGATLMGLDGAVIDRVATATMSLEQNEPGPTQQLTPDPRLMTVAGRSVLLAGRTDVLRAATPLPL